MRDRKLHLVYSSTQSATAIEQRAEWGFENARQLKLFDELDTIRITILPIADISAHSFRNAIRKMKPVLIIDTRKFPEFFSIFSSTDEALSEFQTKGIKYKRISIGSEESEYETWENLTCLKRVLTEYLDLRIGAPVLLLTSTPKKSAKLAESVPGYLTQEVAETHLEDFPR